MLTARAAAGRPYVILGAFATPRAKTLLPVGSIINRPATDPRATAYDAMPVFPFIVIPAKAGIQGFKIRRLPWIPAFAGMTVEKTGLAISERDRPSPSPRPREAGE